MELTFRRNKTIFTVIFLLEANFVIWLFLSYQNDVQFHRNEFAQSDNRPLVVMGILSNDEYTDRRKSVRNTWLKTIKEMDKELPFRIVYKFFLDFSTVETEKENEAHRDIVYLNVTVHGYAKKFGKKMHVLINYIHKTYPDVDLGIRVDDDVFLCVPQIFQRLKEVKSPNLYYGWRHGPRDVLKSSVWIDEMFLVLGKNLIKFVANIPCDKSNCNLHDTNFGDTSLRNWIMGYKDVNFVSDNDILKNYFDLSKGKNRQKYLTVDFCDKNVLFHTVKNALDMEIMHENRQRLHEMISDGSFVSGSQFSGGGSVSGSPFSGEVKRKHPNFDPVDDMKIVNTTHKTDKCAFWAVVTTIFTPSNAVINLSNLSDWCVVIVADSRTPSKNKYLSLMGKTKSNRIKFLSVQDQNVLYPLLSKSIPLNSFSRKNIGYMYAIQNKAQLIWDFDDDNIGIINNQQLKTIYNYSYECEKDNKSVLINPYPYFRKTNIRSWPRGFPLDYIKRNNTILKLCREHKKTQLGVIQSLANGEADVDAIYRLTYDFPFNFTSKQDHNQLLILPEKTFTPFNAQATLWFPEAFQYLALPTSVNGRVSDIWRSYIAEHFFHKMNLKVAFSSPFVFHNRSDHNIMGDFNAENPLYEQTGKLVELLSSTSYKDLISMYDDLYQRLYLEHEDLLFIRAWVKTFQFVKNKN